MSVKKYRAKGKLTHVGQISFTPNQHSPFQSFRLDNSDTSFNYFGPLDLTEIPIGSEMDFQYEIRCKFSNVRELQGYDHVPRLDMKALKEDYQKGKGAYGNGDNTESGMEENPVKNSSPRPVENIEYQKSISSDMRIKARMNAGNTAKSLLELACNASARNPDGSINEESLTKFYQILMEKYDEGVNRIFHSTLKEK